MHNVNVEAVERTAAMAVSDPAAVVNAVRFTGGFDVEEGRPQFRGTIAFPGGETIFEADFPPPMGGTGAAPNPLAYCFWGGLACYAMTFAQEAARRGIELRALRAEVSTDVDLSRALGVSERPPVEEIEWRLDVDSDAPAEQLDELKLLSDEHCPGAYCIKNPIALSTSLGPLGD